MLDQNKLKDGLIDALKKGEETQAVSGGEEGEMEAKYTDSDVAGFMADAIVAYASDAVIGPLAGIIITPPGAPSSANGQMPAVKTADVGKEPLKAAILAGFKAMDAPLAMMTAGIVAYAAASFTVMQAGPANCLGAAVMAVPPVLSAVNLAVQNSEGALEDWCDMAAAAIHVSFKATIFTGVCTASDGGVGPAIGPLQ